jgi:hypothetical protein
MAQLSTSRNSSTSSTTTTTTTATTETLNADMTDEQAASEGVLSTILAADASISDAECRWLLLFVVFFKICDCIGNNKMIYEKYFRRHCNGNE